MKTALISVFDKQGIEGIARQLIEVGWRILSTGGTAKHLLEHGLSVIDIAEMTGFQEMLGGRVKTLHPYVFAPILARPDEMKLGPGRDFPVERIDLLIIDFYPFEKACLDKKLNDAAKIEMIDVGGPSMVRAAAKNHQHVIVVVDPQERDQIVSLLAAGQEITMAERRRLARKAFALTAAYDARIAEYLAPANPGDQTVNLAGRLFQPLRYGENPHQLAALYQIDSESAFLKMRQLQGKELSYNNLLDSSAVYEMLNEFPGRDHFAVIVKHQNPCGAAICSSQPPAWEKAWNADTQSAFGGIAGFNKELNAACAERLQSLFLEVILAPAFSPEARRILTTKKNLRLLEIPLGYHDSRNLRSVPGGFLLQTTDRGAEPIFTVKTSRQPNNREWRDLKFAWRLIKFIKSNGIILVKNGALCGVGAGQMSRIDAVNIALQKSAAECRGAVLASDAFFPFNDAVAVASARGVKVLVEPGGSIRDQEVIEAAEKAGISLVFTGVRHFRH